MRRMMLGLAAALSLAGAAAQAAPTCQDRNGDTIRCGTPGAMPVGWTLPPQQRTPHGPDGPSAAEIFSVMCLIGGLFALIALMPDFDGEWDEQEEDRAKRWWRSG